MFTLLLLVLSGSPMAFGLPPISDCHSLAHAALGPNITVLSAEETTATPTAIHSPAMRGGAPHNVDEHELLMQNATCTFEKDVDVGDPSTIVASFKGLVDEQKCCAACYANPKCSVAAILPGSVSPGPGCWLKTGAGRTYAAKGKTICRTTRPPAKKSSYCLIKVLVQPAINIWVGLPSDGSYNDRFMALGGGGFVGGVGEPTKAVQAGYAGATTDTGHVGSSGSFGMLKPGVPNMQLQTDFGWRSEHMMAVVSKKLIHMFYGKLPRFSYWNGCSTGGRQGHAMAQRFPDDYDGILAGAPAIHFEKLGLGQTWPQVPMLMENDGKSIGLLKLQSATDAAVKACDPVDGVTDGVIRDPRACNYSASALVPSGALTPKEAIAIDKIWTGSHDKNGTLSWYGIPRGASFDALANRQLMSIAYGQAKYWVELDPSWDYHSLTYDNYSAFYDKTCRAMTPGPTTTDNPKSISAFRDKGGKLVMWHGWADQMIMPQGSIDYYNQVINVSDGGDLSATQKWFRFFMAPGVAHCGMDTDPYFDAVVAWVENGTAPEYILHQVSAKTTRPLCPHPKVAVYKGSGSTDDAANFECGPNPVDAGGVDVVEVVNARQNNRIFGKPYIASAPCPGC